MIKLIAENLLQLLIVLPIIFFAIKKNNNETLKILIAFSLFYLLNSILLYLPIIYPETQISNWNATWNWTGKIYSIIGSILFLMFYRKFELKDYFLTVKQNTQFSRKGMIIISCLLTIQLLVSYFFIPQKNWSLETLLYQFSMPGINEEIAYRGIMLGLLTKALKSKNSFINAPLFVTAILFGLAHGLFLTNEYTIIFKSESFLRTFILGLLWGWLTIKSGSILLALLSHNLGNGVGNLFRMR